MTTQEETGKMKTRAFALLICLLLLAGCAAPTTRTEGYTFTDSTGTAITVKEKPEKVAVLLSSLADLWVTAGGRVDITVGETVQRGFAADSAVLVDEGAGKSINLELLLASEPDLVIYSPDIAGQAECADALREAGIPTAGFLVDCFQDYLKILDICTEMTGCPDRAVTYGDQVAQRVEKLIADAGTRAEQPSILFVRAGSSARYTKAKTADTHFVCRMLDDLGTTNIADTAPVLLDGLSTEEILLADPDFIFYTTMGDEKSGVAYMESLLADPVWSTLSAVRGGRVYQLPKDLFQYKPNARWDEAYAYLSSLLYGEEP